MTTWSVVGALNLDRIPGFLKRAGLEAVTDSVQAINKLRPAVDADHVLAYQGAGGVIDAEEIRQTILTKVNELVS